MTNIQSNQAFITKYNFAKLTFSDDGRLQWRNHLLKRYDMTFKEFLAEPEIRRLNVYAELLMEFDELAEQQRIFIRQEADHLNLLYPPKAPSFHAHAGCSALHHDYENFYIPESIKLLGKTAVLKFRDFFAQHRSTYESAPSLFQFMVQNKFKVQVPSMDRVHRLNSGIETIDNPENSIAKIKAYAKKMTDYKHSDPAITKTIKAKGYGTHRLLHGNKNKTDDHVLQQWHRMKQHLKQLIRVNLTADINPQLKFKKTLLEQLGFQECARCK